MSVGSPFNLGQAQEHLSQGRLRDRITWRQADPLKVLTDEDENYDIAVMTLCTWYFASPAVLNELLLALVNRVKHVCIAEWSLSSASGLGNAHVLAALTQAARECHDPKSEANIRTILSPQQITAAAVNSGWSLTDDFFDFFAPLDHVLDGVWETQVVVDAQFIEYVNEVLPDTEENARQRHVVFAMRDATLASVQKVGGLKNVKSMDVWCAELRIG